MVVFSLLLLKILLFFLLLLPFIVLILFFCLPTLIANRLHHAILHLFIAIALILFFPLVAHHLQHLLQAVGGYFFFVDHYVFLYDFHFLFDFDGFINWMSEEDLISRKSFLEFPYFRTAILCLHCY